MMRNFDDPNWWRGSGSRSVQNNNNDNDNDEPLTDNTEIVINNVLCTPFIFDKSLKRDNNIRDILVPDKNTTDRLIIALKDPNIKDNQERILQLYNREAMPSRYIVDNLSLFINNTELGNTNLHRVRPPPITSMQAAFDMLIVYVRSLTRDIPFNDWKNNKSILSYIHDLNDILKIYGNDINTYGFLYDGQIVPETFLKGNFVDENKGFFWNQFQMIPSLTGITNQINIQTFISEQDCYSSVSKQGYIDQQNGKIGFSKTFINSNKRNNTPEIIYRPRSIIGFVHNDILNAGFNDALYCLLRCSRNDLPMQSLFLNNKRMLSQANNLFFSVSCSTTTN